MSLRVLIADDDLVTLNLVAQTLERLGFDVRCAEDGDALLQTLASEHFDLVITDVSMPWMTGLQVAHTVRAAGLHTPLLVITALPMEPATVAALGPDAQLLRKPFRIKQLVSAIGQLLRAESHQLPPQSGTSS